MTQLLPVLLHDEGLFIDPFGTVHPVVQWIDAAGDDVEGPDEAVMAIAGQPGLWFHVHLCHFPRSTKQ